MAQQRRLFAHPDAAPSSAPAAADTTGVVCALDAEEAHYATHVLRLGDGDAVHLLDGHGHGAEATLQVAGAGRRAEVTAVRHGPWRLHPALAQAPALTVVVPLPKGERADWMVEKLGELACLAVVVVHTHRSVQGEGQAAHKRLERLARVARAACRQARHGRVPRLPRAALSLAEALGPQGPIPATAERWVADLDPALPSFAEAARRAHAAGAPTPAHAVLLGPEGGLTEDELNQARAFGYTPVGLGPHVLRVETAAVAAAIALQQG